MPDHAAILANMRITLAWLRAGKPRSCRLLITTYEGEVLGLSLFTEAAEMQLRDVAIAQFERDIAYLEQKVEG